MSHAGGLVRFPDGAVFWAEYNGTSDVWQPCLFVDQLELPKNQLIARRGEMHNLVFLLEHMIKDA